MRAKTHAICLTSLFFFSFTLLLPGVPAHSFAHPAGSKVQSRFTTLDGARIHYVNYGKGDNALVFIHGWTCNIDAWRDQLPFFAKDYHVIALDLPGHGESDKPQVSYSMDYFARAIDAVLRDAKVKQVVLVGHSMGTPVARQFYRKYPGKVGSIVVVDGVLQPFGDKQMVDNMLAGFRSPQYREVAANMMTMISGPNLQQEARDRIKSSQANTPQHVFVGAMEGMIDPSIWIDDKINVPVLAIMAKTALLPPDIKQTAHKIAPDLDFRMWDGVGHFLMMEKPTEFNEAVLAFLTQRRLLR
jgi:pimeloyl-ACP methyl ester carboxylesterase